MALEAGKLDASVVIPSRDRPKSLPLVLDDLFSQAGSRRFEVIVVDDGSEPPIECTSEDAVVPITVLRLEGCGPAVARNVGWRAARADVILFTDDDVRLSENWVDVACRAFEADSSVVAVEGPVKTRTFDWLFEYSVSAERGGGGLTCNVAYTKALLERIGGFDEAFPGPACEDLDLSMRATAVGASAFASEMMVEHIPRPMRLSDFAHRGTFVQSELRLIRKNRQHYSPRMPFWFFPLFYHGRHWAYVAYHERSRLISDPRRGRRWALAASAELSMVCLTLVRSLISAMTR